MAQAEGTIASKNIGKDSIANALQSNKVDKRRCLFLMTGKILLT